MNMGKLFVVNHSLLYIQGRDHTNAQNVKEPSLPSQTLMFIKEFTQEKSPTYVMNVRKFFLLGPNSLSTKKFTQERSLIVAVSVGKPTVGKLSLFYTREVTQE